MPIQLLISSATQYKRVISIQQLLAASFQANHTMTYLIHSNAFFSWIHQADLETKPIKKSCAYVPIAELLSLHLLYESVDQTHCYEWVSLMPDVAGYSCPVGSSQRYTDCMPSPKFCRDERSTGGGEADQDLPGLSSLGSATGADYGSCIQGCACADGELMDDRRTCASKDNCTCYDTYSGTVVEAGGTAHLLCGIWWEIQYDESFSSIALGEDVFIWIVIIVRNIRV